MYQHPCRLFPSGKMKASNTTCFGAVLTFCFCLFDCFSGSDPGFFFRVLGWHKACMLDEGRDPLEVFPQAVHLPKGHKQQPVLPHHHPASGSWINTKVIPSQELLCQQDTNTYWSSFFCRLAAVYPANRRRGWHVRLLPFWSVFIS